MQHDIHNFKSEGTIPGRFPLENYGGFKFVKRYDKQCTNVLMFVIVLHSSKDVAGREEVEQTKLSASY